MKFKTILIVLVSTAFIFACLCIPPVDSDAEVEGKVVVFLDRVALLENKSDKIITDLKFWDIESAQAEFDSLGAEVTALKANISDICSLTEENKDSLSNYSRYKRVCDGYSDYLNTCAPSMLDAYKSVLAYNQEVNSAMQAEIDEAHLNASIGKCKTSVDKYVYAAGSCQAIVNKYPEILNETFNVSELRASCESEEAAIINFTASPYKKLYGFIRGPGLMCTYQKEVYPFLAKLSARLELPLVDCSIGNAGDKKESFKLTVEVPGWSETSIDSITIPPKELRDVNQTLVFKQKLYENNEMTDGVLHLKVEKGSETLFEATKPVRIGSKNDFVLIPDLEPLLVEWITPNDPAVLNIISKAKEYMPYRSFTGYGESTKSAQRDSTILQLNALYNALQDQGISYVSSTVSFNYMDSQRIRLPRESLQQKSANCIDGTVLFASLAESIGFNTYILLVPGHSYLAVEAYPGAPPEDWVPIETTMIGTSTFEESVTYAIEASNEVYSYQSEIIYIDTAMARELGITPMG